ncbi:6-carboxytetrahydropterin synthase [Clostridium sp.]|uniref:6-carboxytetrahydropterin synthase n=1 Tax=Clostridium sp. TaxID=1506 RepID=UPI0026DD6619|nr:6-carboxytetrahydropterin synthase [Clostridium sp.]MDO5038567.1 6-carboxytetrahydropterin synthase [Clostridium sp.]
MSYFLEGEESFDSSHFLKGHSGKCKNLHGHRWRVKYGLKAENLIESGSSKGMIIDFSDIKNIIKEYFKNYDHALIFTDENVTNEERIFIDACRRMNFKIVNISVRSTAENMCKLFFCELENELSKVIKNKNFKIDYITVYETPNNKATYRECN